MQTLQGVAPVTLPLPGHANAQTAKGIAPPPPLRDSAPPPPPAPLAAAFAKPSVVIAPPDVDALTAQPEEEKSAPLKPLPQLVIESPSAPSTEVVAEAAEGKRASVHEVPTDPGGPESVALPPESEWGALFAPPNVTEPAAPSEAVAAAPPTERRPVHESHESLIAAAREEGEPADAPKEPPRPLSVFDTETVAEDEEDALPPPALTAKLDASDVEFTRPLPPELAHGLEDAERAAELDRVAMEQYGAGGDDDLTRPLVSASDLGGFGSTLPRPVPPPPAPPKVPVVVAFPPPRATAIDHAPSVQIADESSTEVTVPRSPLTAQGPSGLPRIPPPAPVPAEFNDRSTRRSRAFAESIAPATGSIFPASSSKLGNRTVFTAAAAIVGLGVLFLLFRPSSGSALLTVGGPGGAAVQGISVKVDGTERCTSTPCEIPELKPGTHIITASATGLTGSTEETIRVERGEQTAHHVALKGEKVRPAEPVEEKPAPVAEAPKEEPKAAPAEEEKAPVAEAPKDEPAVAKTQPKHVASASSKSEPSVKASRSTHAAAAPAPAVASTKAAPAAKPAAPVASGAATLDITSTPRAAVVVNGKPVGMTPLKGVKVASGKQTIVFVHPDLGRKVASANVAPGGRSSVGVKF